MTTFKKLMSGNFDKKFRHGDKNKIVDHDKMARNNDIIDRIDDNINPPSHHEVCNTSNSDDILNASDLSCANIL